MDKETKKVNKEKDASVLAEELLKSYADKWADGYAAEAEELLRDDEQYQKAVTKYGKYKRKSLKQRALRCAAVLICAIFIASIVVPIPQADAWRVWWLDLVTGENSQDIDVRPNDGYMGEYYVAELPEGFELEAEECKDGRRIASYRNSEDKTITFMQVYNPAANNHIDNEKTDYVTRMIGEFEVYVGQNEDCYSFEMMTEKTFLVVSTDADYAIGVQFIEHLHEIS